MVLKVVVYCEKFEGLERVNIDKYKLYNIYICRQMFLFMMVQVFILLYYIGDRKFDIDW